MNEELGEIMIQAAKEVNKKYEQRALEKAKEEGLKEGKEEGLKEIAKKLKEIHTPEEISKITGLTLQTILLL
jgi:flagellar biosynthesis/type III secretory pathway protein FliH